MVNYIKSSSGLATQNMVVGGVGTEWYDGMSINFASSTDPVYTIHCTLYSCPDIEGGQMRCPVGAKPPTQYDRQLVCVQPNGDTFCLWESSVPNGTGGTLNVSSGGRQMIDGDGTGANCTAGLSGPAGEISSTEWMSGQINHAIGITIYRTKPGSVYPVRDDPPGCGGHNAATDSTSTVPNGQWFKLNVTDADLAAEPVWRRAVYRAMRDYGAFVIDTGASWAWEHQNEMTYTAYGVQDPLRNWLIGQSGVSTDSSGRAVARTPSFPFDKLVALNPPPQALPCP
jgi:hypothetical protein